MRAASPEERKALGVPPAYTDVMITEDPTADLRATAKITSPSGKIKTFYKYSQAYVDRQAATKFKRVKNLAAKIEKIEARVERDCQTPELRDVATCLRLILMTGIRIGNPHQGKDISYGAATLLVQHVTLDENRVRLQFKGKKQVDQDCTFEDPLIATYVRQRITEGAEELFPVDAAAVLRYAKSLGAQKVHDFRTFHAMTMAEELIVLYTKDGPPTTKKAAKFLQKTIATQIAKVLGNNPAQVVKSYVSSRIWPEPLD
jgi:DNA topoisomerase IB